VVKDKLADTWSFEHPVTALGADTSGQWLVAGHDDGTLSALDREEKDGFTLGDSRKVHEGRVQALCFEPEELRVLSAGSDVRIFATHVRGALDPAERSGRGMHDNSVVAFALGPHNKRVFTGS